MAVTSIDDVAGTLPEIDDHEVETPDSNAAKHPLDPLDGREIAAAAAILKRVYAEVDGLRFERLEVLEPDKETELPLALPGIAIGSLLVFIFCLGAMNESRLLGGQAITTIVQDIQKAFTFGQDWPRGSALSVLVVLIAIGLVWPVLQRLDFDHLFGRG